MFSIIQIVFQWMGNLVRTTDGCYFISLYVFVLTQYKCIINFNIRCNVDPQWCFEYASVYMCLWVCISHCLSVCLCICVCVMSFISLDVQNRKRRRRTFASFFYLLTQWTHPVHPWSEKPLFINVWVRKVYFFFSLSHTLFFVHSFFSTSFFHLLKCEKVSELFDDWILTHFVRHFRQLFSIVDAYDRPFLDHFITFDGHWSVLKSWWIEFERILFTHFFPLLLTILSFLSSS